MVHYVAPVILAAVVSSVELSPRGSVLGQSEELYGSQAQNQFSRAQQRQVEDVRNPAFAYALTPEQQISSLESAEPSSPLLRREANQQPMSYLSLDGDGQDTGLFHGGPLDGMPKPSGLAESGNFFVPKGASWVQSSQDPNFMDRFAEPQVPLGPPGRPGRPGRKGPVTYGPPGPPGPPGPLPPGYYTRKMKDPVMDYEGHWTYDPEHPWTYRFGPDYGAQQGIMDMGRVQRHWGQEDPKVARAFAHKFGPPLHIDEPDSIDREYAVQDIVNEAGDWEYPTKSDEDGGLPVFEERVHNPDGEAKFYHDLWVSPKSHGKSAYEPNPLHDHSEFFGPFVIDYDDHDIKLPDWNFEVRSENDHPGRGNIGVGLDNFFYDASNSFVAGRHNIISGQYSAVLGGKDNVAEGRATIVAGGQKNGAIGEGTSVVGGKRNDASGEFSAVIGGEKNWAKGTESAVTGGIHNVAEGKLSVVAGGRGNKAEAEFTSVGGGSGNQAGVTGSIIAGGYGGLTDADSHEEYAVHEGRLPEVEEEDIHHH